MTKYIVESDYDCSDELHQVVQRVVCCYDCRYGSFCDSRHAGFCRAFSGHILYVQPDGFCHKGKPKEV